MKGDDVGDSNSLCGNHGNQWDWGVDALAMYEVPPTLADYSCNLGSEVIISVPRPGRDSQNRDAVNYRFSAQFPRSVCREYSNFKTLQLGEMTRNFVHVRLSPTEFWKET